MRSVARLVLAILGLIIVSCGDIGMVGGSDETHTGQAQRTMQGYVYYESTSQPVVDALVRIYASAVEIANLQQIDTNVDDSHWFGAEAIRTVRTNESGHFEITLLDTGSYALEIEIKIGDSLHYYTWTGRIMADTTIYLSTDFAQWFFTVRPWELFSSGATGTADSVYVDYYNTILIEALGSVIIDSAYIATCDTTSGSCSVSFSYIGPVLGHDTIPRDYRWSLVKGNVAYSSASAEYPIACSDYFFYLDDFAFDDNTNQQQRSASVIFHFRRLFKDKGFGIFGVDTLLVFESAPKQ